MKTLLVIIFVALFQMISLAQFRFTNSTRITLSVAFGYYENGVWFSKGWYNISPGNTATVYGTQLTNRYYYYYAESTDNSMIWSGDSWFYTLSNAFTINNNNPGDSYNLQRKQFKLVDVAGFSSYNLSLTDGKPDFNPVHIKWD